MFDKNQCQQVESWIQDSLDLRQPADSDPRVLQHVAVCAECDERLMAYVQLSDVLEMAFHSPTESIPNGCEIGLGENSIDIGRDSLISSNLPVLEPHSIGDILGGAARERANTPGNHDSGKSISVPTTMRRSTVHPRQLSWQSLVGTLAASVLAIVAFEGRFPFPAPSISRDNPVVARQNGAPAASIPSPTQSGSYLNLPSAYDVGDWYFGSMWGSNREPVKANPVRATPASLLTCYELTSELPGVRPLRGSVDMTWGYLQKFMSSDSEPPQQRLPKQPDVGRDNRYADSALFI